MPAQVRMIGKKRHTLGIHGISRQRADNIATRHRLLGMNAKVIRGKTNGKTTYSVYRACSNNPLAQRKRANLKRIHVNRFMISANRNLPMADRQPPMTIQTSKGPINANKVEILGESSFEYSPDNPLSCGATAYGVTRAPIMIDDCVVMP